MVKSLDTRNAKYSGKFSPTTISDRYTQLKTYAVQAFNDGAANQVSVETTCKSYLAGISAIVNPMLIAGYIGYGRQVDKVVRTHGTSALAVSEAQLRAQGWFKRGFTATVLKGIAALFSVTISLPS